MDETVFLTAGYTGTTWGPVGKTPHIKHRMRNRKKVTVLGSLTVSPDRCRCGLYVDFLLQRSVTQEDLIVHLRRLRRSVRTPLVVVLDNLKQHKGKRLRAWCDSVGDVSLEPLPAYAPELNPAEGVWSHGKRVTAAGRWVETLDEMEDLASEAMDAASEQRLLRGFVRGTELPFKFDLQKRKRLSDPQ